MRKARAQIAHNQQGLEEQAISQSHVAIHASDPQRFFVGPQGPEGPPSGDETKMKVRGPQGFEGPEGKRGHQGPEQPTITGSQGPEGYGVQGPQGLATSGPQGAVGHGTRGPQGAVGHGTSGPQGDVGHGTRGPQGAVGHGTSGAQGVVGHGTIGPQGAIGNGTSGPQGPSGVNGKDNNVQHLQWVSHELIVVDETSQGNLSIMHLSLLPGHPVVRFTCQVQTFVHNCNPCDLIATLFINKVRHMVASNTLRLYHKGQNMQLFVELPGLPNIPERSVVTVELNVQSVFLKHIPFTISHCVIDASVSQ